MFKTVVDVPKNTGNMVEIHGLRLIYFPLAQRAILKNSTGHKWPWAAVSLASSENAVAPTQTSTFFGFTPSIDVLSPTWDIAIVLFLLIHREKKKQSNRSPLKRD